MYEEGSEGGLRGTFEIYRAEGDSLFKNGEYKKAIDSFTNALELRENDKDCLVSRARCHLMLGDNYKALKDAETSLEETPDYHKGLYQKAEALYAKGEFEWALMFYHRGFKLRPELQEFRLGIQKAQEAIDNAVGSPESVQLTKDGDLTYFEEQVNESKPRGKGTRTGGYNRPESREGRRKKEPVKSCAKDKTVKQLLGEMYGDRMYLEMLLKETVCVLKTFKDGLNEAIKHRSEEKSPSGAAVHGLAYDGIMYLDKRTEFWRQQKPMYARKRDRLQKKADKQQGKDSPNKYIVKELEKIDEEQSEGKFEESLKRAKRCLKTIHGYPEDAIVNRAEVIANLHSNIGNAHLELGDLGKAQAAHQKDYDIGEEHDIEEAKSRALDNMGRVYARQGEYEKAINAWERKIPLAKTPLETTWLYHEIGRCHLELGNFEQGKDYGDKSVAAANEAGDEMWQLNATVLVAQSEVKLNDLNAALSSFEAALDMAKVQRDEAAESAIKKAIDDVNSKIVKTIKEENEDGEHKGANETEQEDEYKEEAFESEEKKQSDNGAAKSQQETAEKQDEGEESKSPERAESKASSPVKEEEKEPSEKAPSEAAEDVKGGDEEEQEQEEKEEETTKKSGNTDDDDERKETPEAETVKD